MPEYWIVDVVARTVEVYSEPLDDAYARGVRYAQGDAIVLGAFPVSLRVLDVVR